MTSDLTFTTTSTSTSRLRQRVHRFHPSLFPISYCQKITSSKNGCFSFVHRTPDAPFRDTSTHACDHGSTVSYHRLSFKYPRPVATLPTTITPLSATTTPYLGIISAKTDASRTSSALKSSHELCIAPGPYYHPPPPSLTSQCCCSPTEIPTSPTQSPRSPNQRSSLEVPTEHNGDGDEGRIAGSSGYTVRPSVRVCTTDCTLNTLAVLTHVFSPQSHGLDSTCWLLVSALHTTSSDLRNRSRSTLHQCTTRRFPRNSVLSNTLAREVTCSRFCSELTVVHCRYKLYCMSSP
jgi:hypothetical protein